MLHFDPNRHISGKVLIICFISMSMLFASCAGSTSHTSIHLTPTSSCTHLTSPSAPLKLAGLGYGPYHNGQSPDLSVFPSSTEVQADMATLKSLTSYIRIYSSTGPARDIIQAAEANDMQVALGVWLGSVPAANEAEISAGEQLAASKAVRAVIVGNEVLLRGDLTEDQLHHYLTRVRAKLGSSVPLSMADTANEWLAHPNLANDVDFITVHIYPFWENVPIDCAIQALDTEYQKVVDTFPNKPVVIGETGWPSAVSVDTPLGSQCLSQNSTPSTPTPVPSVVPSPGTTPTTAGAVPSAANQELYLKDFVTWAQQKKVQYFYFDAFDESWKIHEHGVGTHWGLYQQNGQLKPSLADLLPAADPATVALRNYSYDVAVGGLEAGFDLGIDTSKHTYGWLKAQAGVFTLAFPANQQWGAMFITACKSVPPEQRLFSVDLSAYQSLSFDMRTAQDGQCVKVGIKDWKQPDDGSEQKADECLTTQWTTYTRPLSIFSDADLTHLYVVFEVVYLGSSSLTVQVRNVRYSTTLPTATSTDVPSSISRVCGADDSAYRRVGDLILSQPSLEPGALPSIKLPDNMPPGQPYQLPGPQGMISATDINYNPNYPISLVPGPGPHGMIDNPNLLLANPNLSGGWFASYGFTICNLSTSHSYVLQSGMAQIAGVIPDASAHLNVQIPCDGTFSSIYGALGGWCYIGGPSIGGGSCYNNSGTSTGENIFMATWPNTVKSGTIASQVTQIYTQSRSQIPCLPYSLQPGKTYEMFMNMDYPSSAGTYAFQFGVQTDKGLALSPATYPVFLAKKVALWSGYSCEKNYQSVIPTTGDEKFYVCPET